MSQAARAARRRAGTTPYRRKPLRRHSPTNAVREALGAFLPPVVGGIAFLLLYILGLLDVIATRPALAADAFLLVLMVLFFPMRYAHRLSPRQRWLAALLALVWIAVIFYPIYRRIYPGERLFTVDASSQDVPIRLPSSGYSRLDLLIDGHLDDPGPGRVALARYAVTVASSAAPPQTFAGEFKETWQRQRQAPNQPVEVLRERRAKTFVVDNPGLEDLRVTALRVEGHARPVLTLSLYPHLLPSIWLVAALGIGLLGAAVLFDRATGAGETAASMVIATAAAFVGAHTFPGIGSPNPTFRELAGAAIVGALLGGPIGGLVAWSTRRRPVATLGARAR